MKGKRICKITRILQECGTENSLPAWMIGDDSPLVKLLWNIPHLVPCNFTLARVAGRSVVVSVSYMDTKGLRMRTPELYSQVFGSHSNIGQELRLSQLVTAWCNHAIKTKAVGLIPERVIQFRTGLESPYGSLSSYILWICIVSLFPHAKWEKQLWDSYMSLLRKRKDPAVK